MCPSRPPGHFHESIGEASLDLFVELFAGRRRHTDPKTARVKPRQRAREVLPEELTVILLELAPLYDVARDFTVREHLWHGIGQRADGRHHDVRGAKRTW